MFATIRHGNSVTASIVWIMQSDVEATALRPAGETRKTRVSADVPTETMILVRLVKVRVSI